jgi:predicted tellurium resistance membrane protein TerC
MDTLLTLAADPKAWAALATLIAMEVVLGIDNLIFIAILTNRLPEERRNIARKVGIGLALIMRLAAARDHRDHRHADRAAVRNLRRGLLLARHHPDRRRPVPGLEGDEGNPPPSRSRSRAGRVRPQRGGIGFGGAMVQIVLLDLVFSIDSILTAVGMTTHVPIMVIAVVVAVLVMLLAATPLANFINGNPTIVMLALGFLLMIGMVLIADGFGAPVPKGYIYAAMAFSALVEGLNMMSRRANRRRAAEAAQAHGS